MSDPLLEVHNLSVLFSNAGHEIHAVRNLSLTLQTGEVLTILGESGSGKSVTLNAILRLLPENGTTVSGKVIVDGQDVFAMTNREVRAYRGAKVSMVFQEPALAFDPMFTVGYQIIETLRAHRNISIDEAERRALELMELVRIPSAKVCMRRYPHEMSGGMRQRAMIALALCCDPKVLLADEPTTALDVTVQIQMLVLLRELQRELGMAIVFVTHDIGVANEISDHVAVMYAGRVVECGAALDVLGNPKHPYTKALLESSIHGTDRGQRLPVIPGAPPDLAEMSQGCSFAPRCALANQYCLRELPDLRPVTTNHLAACINI